MSEPEQNTSLVRSYVEAFNRGDWDALRTIFAPDAIIQGVLGRGGMEVVIPIWQQLHESFSIQLTIDALVAQGDCVAARYTERGTFRAAFRGQPATGRSYELVAMEWFTVRDGRIQQRWGARDSASQARQIGLSLA